MKCEAHPLNTLKTYKYVVVFARYKGQWLFVKHKKRSTWETAGGHIEPGETPDFAAMRELREESGATAFSIEPVCDYWASDEPYEAFPPTEANGVVYLARIRELGPIPDPVMEKTGLFDGLPDKLTYPGITPVIFEHAREKVWPFIIS